MNASCYRGSQANITSYYGAIDKENDDFIYTNDISIVQGAGNEGEGTGYIIPGAKGLNVITVGNYNDHNDNSSLYEVRASSSYVNPTNTYNTKPEVVAPGVAINPSLPWSSIHCTDDCTGTSFSAPIVSSMISNRASMWTNPNSVSVTPALMKAMVLNGANDTVIDSTVGGQSHIGLGGVDFEHMYYVNRYSWIEGSFESHDAADNWPNNGCIDRTFIPPSGSSHGKIVLSWLVRGSWILQNLSSPFHSGMFFNINVLDPNGNLIQWDWNNSNGYIVVEFPITQSGTYHWKISKILDSYWDSNAVLKMAYVVNFD